MDGDHPGDKGISKRRTDLGKTKWEDVNWT